LLHPPVVALFALLGWLGTCAVGPVQGGKVLVMPVEGSHWLSMRMLVAELSRRGHDTVVLVPETSILIGDSTYGRTEVFHVPYNKEELEDNMNKFRDNAFGKRPQAMDLFVNVGLLLNFTALQVRGCKGLLYDEPLMHKLRSEGFDVVLTDPFLPCGTILASVLDIPVVYFLRGLPCGLEYQAMQCPSPPSFVPRFFTGNTDVMTFPQRGLQTGKHAMGAVWKSLFAYPPPFHLPHFFKQGVEVFLLAFVASADVGNRPHVTHTHSGTLCTGHCGTALSSQPWTSPSSWRRSPAQLIIPQGSF
uniref:glucuronosyltransferase n=1 Tax=Paramormyrops kingsleyae TaxID=1676925 RepID=A0A3B3SH05_9TELE